MNINVVSFIAFVPVPLNSSVVVFLLNVVTVIHESHHFLAVGPPFTLGVVYTLSTEWVNNVLRSASLESLSVNPLRTLKKCVQEIGRSFLLSDFDPRSWTTFLNLLPIVYYGGG